MIYLSIIAIKLWQFFAYLIKSINVVHSYSLKDYFNWCAAYISSNWPCFIIILILKVVMVDIKIDIIKQVLIDLPFSRYWVLNTSDKLCYNNESKYIWSGFLIWQLTVNPWLGLRWSYMQPSHFSIFGIN